MCIMIYHWYQTCIMNTMAKNVLLGWTEGLYAAPMPHAPWEVRSGPQSLTVLPSWGTKQLRGGSHTSEGGELGSNFTLPHLATWQKDRDLTEPNPFAGTTGPGPSPDWIWALQLAQIRCWDCNLWDWSPSLGTTQVMMLLYGVLIFPQVNLNKEILLEHFLSHAIFCLPVGSLTMKKFQKFHLTKPFTFFLGFKV